MARPKNTTHANVNDMLFRAIHTVVKRMEQSGIDRDPNVGFTPEAVHHLCELLYTQLNIQHEFHTLKSLESRFNELEQRLTHMMTFGQME